jgi:hypothetical protein
VSSIKHVDTDHRDWNHRLIPSILKEEAQPISRSSVRKLARTKAKENSVQKGQNTHKLWILIALCKDSKRHDPRDKVYGLIGITTDLEKTRSWWDYSTTLFEVWEDIYCAILCQP